MSNVESHQSLMPSLLDRLIDPDSAGTAERRGYSLQQMMDAVRRDVEEILNTRRSLIDDMRAYPECHNSVIAYGFPDFGSIRSTTRGDHLTMATYIEELVAKFEPRLKDIKAYLVEDLNEMKQFRVKFQIQGRLKVEPSPEVAFETVLELTTGHSSVKRSRR